LPRSGICFGGTTVLELARGGADLRAGVSFHGGLDTPSAEDARNIRGRVLVLHGADDPYVKPAEVAAFQEEMRKAGVDWQFVAYGGAVHSFTNPGAGSDNSKGLHTTRRRIAAPGRRWRIFSKRR
jgi:dienelactone hydrolase